MDTQEKFTLLFRVEEAATDVVLSCDGKEIERVRIESNRELLERILPATDGLLLRWKIAPRDVSDICVESELPDGYSSRRIAETVAKAWKLGRDESEEDRMRNGE